MERGHSMKNLFLIITLLIFISCASSSVKYQIVQQATINNQTISAGLTPSHVQKSIGPPDKVDVRYGFDYPWKRSYRIYWHYGDNCIRFKNNSADMIRIVEEVPLRD